MITIKKRSIASIIVVSLLIGGIVAGLSLWGMMRLGGVVAVSAKEFAAMEQMYEKYGKLDSLFRFVETNYYEEVDPEALKLGTYRGLFFGLGDLYSYYMTADEYKALMMTTSSELQGIGVTFSANLQNQLIIVSTLDGSPAQNVGLQAGDIILMVDGVSYGAAEMDEAGTKMRGTPGTAVTLTIRRGEETKEYTITRANIVKHTVKTEMLEDGIAYIRISAFEENTGAEFQSELRALELKQAKGLVIDLRNNGGGVVSTGIEIADLLLPACTIIDMVAHNGDKETATSDEHATSIPYVLLVNESTASTSEILAAAVKDNDGGKLVGVTTFGKGIIQSVIPLTDGSGDAVKMTTSQYLSPSGNVIHDKGVEPDYIVFMEDGEEQDIQLQKALELLRK